MNEEWVVGPSRVPLKTVNQALLQFFKEENLPRTFAAFQAETDLKLPGAHNLTLLVRNTEDGKWPEVFKELGTTEISTRLMYEVVEVVCYELLNNHEVALAGDLLRLPCISLQAHEDPMRVAALEASVLKGKLSHPLDEREIASRRSVLSQKIAQDLPELLYSRFLRILQHHVFYKRQNTIGALDAPDILQLRSSLNAEMQMISVKFRSLELSEIPTCADFSPDGRFVVFGFEDGILEVWDWQMGCISNDLPYQITGASMMHTTSISAVCFSSDSRVLASASVDGKIKVWMVETGECKRIIERAHDAAITRIKFSHGCHNLLTASLDSTVRIHGLKSGKTIKRFEGHTTFVTDATYTYDRRRVMSVSADGSVRVWDCKSGRQIETFSPNKETEQTQLSQNPLLVVSPVETRDEYFVCSRESTSHIFNATGKVLHTFCTGKKVEAECVTGTVSPGGGWAVMAGEDKSLYVFSSKTGKLESYLPQVHQAEILGIVYHPYRAVLMSYAREKKVNFYKPW